MSMKTRPIVRPPVPAGPLADHGLRLAQAMGGVGCGMPRRQRSFLINGEMRAVRMPPDLWLALDGIALTEGVMTAFIVEQVARRRTAGVGLAAALRCFILAYHRRD